MLPANIPTATCTRCGWQNEPTARMCGGCGMPLRTSDPGATSNVDLVGSMVSSPLPAAPEQVREADSPYAPTAFMPQHDQLHLAPVYPAPTPAAQPRRLSAPPAIWDRSAVAAPGDTHVQRRSRSPWWRVLLITLVVLSMLAGCGVGAWAFIIRPAAHAQVDASIRTSLNSAIDQVSAKTSQIPSGLTLQITVSASEMEHQIQQHLPENSPISDLHLRFARDGIQISYTLYGNAGAITTHLQTNQGHLQARATSVDYPLAFVEDGPEMESAINAACAHLPSQLTVLAVSTANDILTLSIHT